MSEAWIPVLFAAVIVLGVVGGQLMQMVLKELLPLLRTMAQGRQLLSAKADLAQLPELFASLERRLAQVEANQRELKEESEFLQKLLNDRAGESVLPRPNK